MADYPPLPRVPDLRLPARVCVAWVVAAEHEEAIDALRGFIDRYRYWPAVAELTTGCRCQETPGWYPGRPAVDGCPLHNPHRCNVAMLGRSWRSEGCGWRCPTCTAEWTLQRALVPVEDHATEYGTHPRTQCGPAFCTLLPPRPVMVWVRDAPEDQ